ncbi:MAG: bifunctional 2',3'-cyclic-nucleotide 2'-phosphodiesterase/3'-nucleotidase [Rhodobacteraceae bacterium]|nr:bifunctional 2',3'-cyclic-nucleotide 2'-phosphodiesterase/3'-nucleotidase [Paracoccaceae bacterium]
MGSGNTAPNLLSSNDISVQGERDQRRLHLRVMATSDLHAHVLPWDDLTNQPAPDRGLAQIATLVAEARAEVRDSILLDNGDFLNGSPLADHIAETCKSGTTRTHPMIAAMNQLGYDAATLGNHEFSNGLALLRCALAQADFPVVTTNLVKLSPSGGRSRAFLTRHLLLERWLTDQTGTRHKVTIGLLGFLPPQTALWERRHLEGRLATRGILASARRAEAGLRRAGADIVIALSHSGLGAETPTEENGFEAENVSCALAALDGIDAVVSGHTHQVFPPPSHSEMGGVPSAKAAFAHDKPLVMPGFYGSHLGVIDLVLGHDGARWRVMGHKVALRPVAQRTGPSGQIIPLTSADPAIAGTVACATAAMRQRAGQPVGQTAVALHSYFALIGQSPVQNLLASAQERNMRGLLAGRPEAGLPMLVSVAPFKAGGRGGPSNYTDIPPGPLTACHMADLYIHPNSPVALRVVGRDLSAWLERAVSLFFQVKPGAQDARLINPDFPAYNFDMIHGLTFGVDLSQPARFDARGHVANPGAKRIVGLRHEGVAVDDDQPFILVTNSYRASGGAGFAGTNPAEVVMEESRPLRRVVQEYVAAESPVAPPNRAGWAFAPMPGTSVLFDSGPGAANYSANVAGLGLIGPLPTGFQRFRLQL